MFTKPLGQCTHVEAPCFQCVFKYADKALGGCPTHTDTDQLTKVVEATKEVCSDWNSLAVELDISHGVRKVGVVTGYLRVFD